MRKLSILVIGLFFLAGCAGMHQKATAWESMSPKHKYLVVNDIYNTHFDDVVGMKNHGGNAKIITEKTRMLEDLYIAKELWGDYAEFGFLGEYESPEALERKLLELLNKIGRY